MLSRLETGPLVRMVCIEGWATTHRGPQVTAAAIRQVAIRRIVFRLFKTQGVEAVGCVGGQRDNKLTVDHGGTICHGSPLYWRSETAGLLQHKAGGRICPGNGYLVIAGRDHRDGRHGGDGDTGGEFRSIVGAVSRGGGDGVADRDRS